MAYNDQLAVDLKRCSVLYSRPNFFEEGRDLNSGSGEKVSVWSYWDKNWRVQKEA